MSEKKKAFPRALEDEAIYIMREVAAQFEKPALLFSGGKDSITLVHLVIKASARRFIKLTKFLAKRKFPYHVIQKAFSFENIRHGNNGNFIVGNAGVT